MLKHLIIVLFYVLFNLPKQGYCELAQVLLAMSAKVDDRGSKGDCTPLMDASGNGFLDIVYLLLDHGADVNAQSQAGLCISILYVFIAISRLEIVIIN